MGGRLKRRTIVVLGARSVGKSSLVSNFIENQFEEKYYPTIENTPSKSLKHNGIDYECKIIDTAGQDEFSIFKSNHAIGIHGFILVYSISSRNSFNMVELIYNQIVDFRGMEDIPCVIDLPSFDNVAHSLTMSPSSRQVKPSEGKNLAQQKGAAWVETSANTNINVGKVFELCLTEIEKRLPGKAGAASDKSLSLTSCRIM